MLNQIGKSIGVMSDATYFSLKPTKIIFARLLGQVRCVGRGTVLSENVTVSRVTFRCNFACSH